MITQESLLRSKEYWLEHIQNDLYAQVEQYLEEQGMNRQEFAEQLGVTKGYISQILNGDFDHKLSKLIQLSLSINKAPILRFENLDECIDDYKKGETHFARNERPVVNLVLPADAGIRLTESDSQQSVG
jgi:transcriptional regulator with XRE-family HTH domain